MIRYVCERFEGTSLSLSSSISPSLSLPPTAPIPLQKKSHLIMSVNVDGVNRHTGATSNGRLHLIDLAGSERITKVRKTSFHGTSSIYIYIYIYSR